MVSRHKGHKCGVSKMKINSTYFTHWGRVTHICVCKLTILGSDNGLSPDRRQAIIWTNAGILLIGSMKTNFSEMLIEIHTFSFKKMHLKMSSDKWRPFCLGLNVLLAHCGLYKRHMASWNLINTGSGKGLLPNSNVYWSSVWSCGTHMRVLAQGVL